MSKYRKKPVVIEAVQFQDDVRILMEIQELSDDRTIIVNYNDPNNPYLKIETLEGVMTAQIGDYVIKGVKGEVYPCKPDIFEATYEEVQE